MDSVALQKWRFRKPKVPNDKTITAKPKTPEPQTLFSKCFKYLTLCASQGVSFQLRYNITVLTMRISMEYIAIRSCWLVDQGIPWVNPEESSIYIH